jgi:UDP-2,3-diacylglucosamine pyrophosphatase LpxH
MAGDFNYLIISDLHLQEAEKNPTGRLFSFDQEFADFLRHYRLFQVGERRWRLIIAGDLIEFYYVKEQPDAEDRLLRGTTLTATDRRFFPGTDWQKSVWKLDLILRSHPQLLLALARFVAAGHEIYILRGNHDLELFWPQVQEHFRLLVAQHHPVDTSFLDMKGAVRDRIHFLPWFYLEPGLLYVEHGHQYDEYCSNVHNLYPVLPKNPERIELAISAFTMRYFAARIQNIEPAAMENIDSIPRYLKHMILDNPGQLARMPLYYLEMLIRVLGKVRRPAPERETLVTGKEASIREEILRASGLDNGTLHTLESLGKRPILESWWQTIRCLFLDHLLGGLGGLALAFALAFAGPPRGSLWLTLGALAAIPVIILTGKRRLGRINDHRNLREIARAIHNFLGVRYVVFGHSHDPDVLPFDDGPTWIYFNVGTWVPRAGESQFIYLQIHSDLERPTAHLMRWDRRNQCPVEVDFASYEKGRREQREARPTREAAATSVP